jgi:hypothetical protein
MEWYNLLQAVENYYGADSSQYIDLFMNKYTPQEFASILSQLPNTDVVLNADGSVRSYHVRTPIEIQNGTTSDLISEIDSNVSTSTTNNVSVPLDTNVSTDTQTGTAVVTVEQGAKIAGAGGATATAVVAKPKNWLVPLVAIGTLITLGKITMPELYQEHPEFFGYVSLGLFDRTTWDKVTQEKERVSHGETIISRFIDGFIKVDKDSQTNELSGRAYVDAEAMAYIIKYCIENGVFNTGGSEVISGDDTLSISPCTYPLVSVSSPVYFKRSSDNRVEGYSWDESTIKGMLIIANNSYQLLLVSDSQNNKPVWHVNDNTYQSYLNNRMPNQGKTAFFLASGYSLSTWSLTTGQTSQLVNTNPIWSNLAWNFWYGAQHETPAFDGIEQEEGATTPSFSPDDSYADILQKLQTDYPDLFNDKITQNVVQPDGTVKEYIYLPITLPVPNPNPTDGKEPLDEPISGTQRQEDQKIEPETTPEVIIEYLYPDIVDPRTPNDENTGDGNTPAVVIPTGSASALYTVYNPTESEIHSFGGWLWSSSFVDQLLKMFNDPMQAIISLHKVFCTPSISGRNDIKVGYLNSGVQANVVASQYVTIDCGTVNLSEEFQNVFDYPPFTEVTLYLPFVGFVRLDTNDVMRGSINVVYHIDVLTGACLAEVNVTRDMFGGVIYQYTGDCSVHYPLSSGSYMGMVSALLGVAGTIVSGGSLAPMIIGASAKAMSGRSSVERSGNLSGNAGAMGIKKPYLVIQRPQTNLANTFETFVGKPANYTTKIGDCTGYISCTEVHIENCNGTETELAELENLLKTGILI